MTRRWFETGYDPECDPAVQREREMIHALREHAEALRSVPQSSGPKEPSPASVEPADVHPPSRAEFVSQKTCQQVLGLTPRQFLDLLRRDDAPPVSAVGKLRMVPRDAIVAYLAKLTKKVGDATADELDGADAVLREIGCAPVRRKS